VSEEPLDPVPRRPQPGPIQPLPPVRPDHTVRTFWLLLGPVFVAGTVISWLVADLRAGLSFAGASLLAAGAFVLGAVGVRAADRLAPFAAMIAAVGGYGITVLLFALAYAVADPDVITFPAVAAGLAAAVIAWVVASIRSLTAGVNDE
jgi:hypothetical protein